MCVCVCLFQCASFAQIQTEPSPSLCQSLSWREPFVKNSSFPQKPNKCKYLKASLPIIIARFPACRALLCALQSSTSCLQSSTSFSAELHFLAAKLHFLFSFSFILNPLSARSSSFLLSERLDFSIIVSLLASHH